MESYLVTELCTACTRGDLESVKRLIKLGASPWIRDDQGNNLFHLCCSSVQCGLEVLKYLLSISGIVDCGSLVNNEGSTLLHLACITGKLEFVRFLFTQHQDSFVLHHDIHGHTPLYYSCKNQHSDIVLFICNQNIVLSPDDIYQCVKISTWEIMVPLLKKISFKDFMNRVIQEDHVTLAKLVTKDNVVQWLDSTTLFPLHHAVTLGDVNIVHYLIHNIGYNPDIKDVNGQTPLHIACSYSDNIELVRYLVERCCCCVNAIDKDGHTLLHYACKHGFIEILEYLLDHPDCDTDVLSSLSEYGDKRVQTVINFHNKFQLAMKSTGVAFLRVVKCILTGPPGAGKSTLKKRLLNESLIVPSFSTGVVDAAVPVDSFRKLQQEGGMVSCLQNVTEWNKQNVDEEAVFILESVSSNTAGQHQVKPKKYKSSSNQMSSLLTAFVSASHENSDNQLIDQLAVDENAFDWETLISSDMEGQQVQETVENDNSKAKAVKVLSETVQTIPVTEREIYEERTRQISQDNHAMLHIIDTGGQPEFHEILPALITGPAINLLVFKLTEDLRCRYYITYQSPTGESQPYETSLTHEEVIFRSLASIACLRQNTIGWSFNESPIDDDSESAAFLIATHRDQVDHSKVAEVNEQLKAKIQNSELFHENLVQFASPDQLIYAIDTTYDILEIDELRSMLHKVISNKFQELSIPVSWCTFSIKLRKINKSLHDINSCYKLALECGITDKEDFMFALWFLHHRVGSIMYYPEVNGLKDIVITDLQLVFDCITHLITSCFTFKSSENAALENEFRTTGQFTEEDIIKFSRKSDDRLSPVILISLLRHLHIVAGPTVIKNGPKYYFMPCALKPAVIEEEQRDQSMSLAPLLIYFECGYCPIGVFSCLVVHLLNTKQSSEMDWTLDDTPQFHNKITFRVKKLYYQVTLISRATYLEIWPNTISIGPIVPVYDIYRTLDKAIKIVTQSLHYMYKSRHFFGFPCTTCQSLPPHPAICEYDDPVAAKCVQGGGYIILEMKHTIWFDESKPEDLHTYLAIDSIFKSTPDKHDLLELLADIKHLWFNIGEALRVPYTELKSLLHSPLPDLIKLSSVLQCWIDNYTTEVTWNSIITAVKSKILGQTKISEEIRRHVLRSDVSVSISSKKKHSKLYDDQKNEERKTKALKELKLMEAVYSEQSESSSDNDSDSPPHDISIGCEASQQMKPIKNELQEKIRKTMTKDREKVLVEKKEFLLAMAEKQLKMEDSNQTVTSQVKEKEEITIAQTEDTTQKMELENLQAEVKVLKFTVKENDEKIQMLKEQSEQDKKVKKNMSMELDKTKAKIKELQEEIKKLDKKLLMEDETTCQQAKDVIEKMETESLGLHGAKTNYILHDVYIGGEKMFIIQADSPPLLDWEIYGIRIKLPQGALPPTETGRITIKALVGGHFNMPKGTELISVVYVIFTSKPLLQPVELEIQHCANLVTQDHTNYLSFASAPLNESNLPYQFQLEKGGKFYQNDQYGSIFLSQFSLIAIVKSDSCPIWKLFDSHRTSKETTKSSQPSTQLQRVTESTESLIIKPTIAMNINELNSDIGKTISLPVSSLTNNEIAIQSSSGSTSEQCSGNISSHSITAPDKEAPYIDQERDEPLSYNNGGSPDNVYYAQVVYQIRSPFNSWFMRFIVSKCLNALLEFIRTSLPLNVEKDVDFSFIFETNPDGNSYIELDLNESENNFIGWNIRPHLLPALKYKRNIDMYGSSNPPVCPTILITVSAEDEPSTVTKLNYKISLRGIKPSGTTMYIVRDLCNRGRAGLSEVNIGLNASESMSEPGSNQISSFDSKVAKRALVRCTNIIVKSSIDPSALALELYSEEAISEGTYSAVRDKKTGDSSKDRLELIIDDIKDRVSQNGNILGSFINFLKDLAHKDLAALIVKKYKELENTAEKDHITRDSTIQDVLVEQKKMKNEEKRKKTVKNPKLMEVVYLEQTSDNDSEFSDTSSKDVEEEASGSSYRSKEIPKKKVKGQRNEASVSDQSSRKPQVYNTSPHDYMKHKRHIRENRQRSESNDSDQSDKDHLPQKQKVSKKHKSYDISIGRGKEPVSGKTYQKKGIPSEYESSVPIKRQRTHKVTSDKRLRREDINIDDDNEDNPSETQ